MIIILRKFFYLFNNSYINRFLFHFLSKHTEKKIKLNYEWCKTKKENNNFIKFLKLVMKFKINYISLEHLFSKFDFISIKFGLN